MADQAIHPAASHHLPAFITAPGETDVLMVVMAIVLFVAVVGFGVFFLKLHSLPERMAHKGHKLQFEIVAVMCLIALFTHSNIMWIAALLLALIDIPDVGGWLNRIAGGVERIADNKPGNDPGGTQAADAGAGTAVAPKETPPPLSPHENVAHIRRADGGAHAATDPTHASTRG
jgi:hypothetical protein